ncbi:MAG: SagB/ThcOx family dehydrogenase [Verrucomicrobia bacterium]|nr:SagB/ThcOx family dehydrogenase [Verrucomicrobiota bacterium]
MNTVSRLVSLFVITAAACEVTGAAELQSIQLPPPQTTGGKPFMQVLSERKSLRDFSTRPLPPQTLANLLWAGFGINRATNAHRTAPSAMNSQEIDLYVATADGVFLYDAKMNQLQPVAAGDIRARTGSQPFVKDAPVAVIFVADHARLTKAKPEEKDRYANIDTGFISQNLYLFCASEGLATVVHEVDRVKLKDALRLKPDQRVVIAQSVGFPKEPSPTSGGAQ